MTNGSHQLLWPRLMSVKVLEGAVNVSITRCHLRQARSGFGRGLHCLIVHGLPLEELG